LQQLPPFKQTPFLDSLGLGAPQTALPTFFLSNLTKLLSAVVDKLSVDAKVLLLVLPEKQDLAGSFDLSRAGLSLKEREANPAVGVDLGGTSLTL
jgi:hypothetical protein